MDVFISYEHESKSIADNICSVLESKGIRCWYAPRDVYGDYATSIVNAIDSCRVFVLILNNKASASPHVLNEVELAYQRILNGEITIVPFKVDEGSLSKAMEYYIKRLHWIDAVSENLETAIDHLVKQLMPILGIEEKAELQEKPAGTIKRDNVQYYMPEDKVEAKRLQYEDKLLYDIEKVYYDKLLFDKKDVNVLDVETLNPDATIRRLDRSEVSKVLSFSYNDSLVEYGNSATKGSDKFRFFKLDLKSQSIDDVLAEAMEQMGIDGFDFVNFSMAFMDMKSPFKVVQKLKKFMNPGAVAYVRDVDDGFVVAYPDEHNYFAEFKSFYKLDTMSGSRCTARQVYNIMKKVGAKEIRLEKAGINTSTMDYEHKRLLFKSWFSFIPNDFSIIKKRSPDNEAAGKILKWIDEYYDELEEEFYDDNFLFNSGYVIYTIRF